MSDVFRNFVSNPIGICVLVGFAILALLAFGAWWWSICRFTVPPANIAFVFCFGKRWSVIGEQEIYFRYPKVANFFRLETWNAQGQEVPFTVNVTSRDGISVVIEGSLFASPYWANQEEAWNFYDYEDEDIADGIKEQISGILGSLAEVLDARDFILMRELIGVYLNLVIVFGEKFGGALGADDQWAEILANHPFWEQEIIDLQNQREETDSDEKFRSDLEKKFGVELTLVVIGKVAYDKAYTEALEAKQIAELKKGAAVVDAEKDAEVLKIGAEASAAASQKLREATEAWMQMLPGDPAVAVASAQSALRQPITVTVQSVSGGSGRKPIVVVQSGGGSKP